MPLGVASKDVLIVTSSASRAQGRSNPALDPAMGTLVVSPDHDMKIRKAIIREVRLIKRRLLFRRLFLQFDYLSAQGRGAVLRGLSYLLGNPREG